MGAGLVLLAFSGLGLLRPLEDVSYIFLSPLESALRSIARPIADTVANYGDVRDLTAENDSLRAENERLNAEVARLQEEAVERDQLAGLLDVKTQLSDQQFAVAKVYARSTNNLRDLVAINLGSGDGIKVGMPVVTEGKTLVGTVTEVDSSHSWVTLVTDVDSAVAGLVLESRAQGVVAGSYNHKMSMEFVTQESTVNNGDTVLTSGIGGTYPEGLVLGKVTGVSGNPQDLFRQVSVEPLASLSRLESVLVMTSFLPNKVTGP